MKETENIEKLSNFTIIYIDYFRQGEKLQVLNAQ